MLSKIGNREDGRAHPTLLVQTPDTRRLLYKVLLVTMTIARRSIRACFVVHTLPVMAAAAFLAPRRGPAKKTPHVALPASSSDIATTTATAITASATSETDRCTRRSFGYGVVGLVGGSASVSSVAQAAEGRVPFTATAQADSLSLETGLLDSRVTENVLSPPPYDLEGSDVFYPSWFSGTWRVESVGTDVQAPCGVTLFGGNATYQSALRDVGSTLSYESRFVTAGGTTVVADREYNVKSIARAAMGTNSVVDINLATPNKFSAVLAPKGSPSMLRVDLITLLRRQETIDENRFDCSEVVREIVSPVGGQQQQQPSPASAVASIVKEVETTSLYTYDPVKDAIRCRQRSAVFLLPSQSSPMAMKMFEYSRGRPIDVRFFNVLYTRR